MTNEQIIMQIITNGGNARANALKAIQSARKGDYKKVDELLSSANECLLSAHHVQTSLIQAEIKGESNDVTLLMVHAQDHLMNAMTVRDLAIEIIENIREKGVKV